MKTTVERIEVVFNPIIPQGAMAIVYRSAPGAEPEARIYYPTSYSWFRLGVLTVTSEKIVKRKVPPLPEAL